MTTTQKPPVERRPRIWAVLEPLSVVALFAFLLWKSWLRWPDPLVDFPRELYTAWQLSTGALLYRDVACWYGPLSLLVEAGAFRVFGVGLDTLVWLNIALTGVILWLLRGILWELGPRLMVWLGSVLFLVVFALGQYVLISNYNFITPYCSQATYGFAGLLLALWALLRHLRTERPRYLWLAGVGLAIAYLDKPESLLAVVGALTVYCALRFTSLARTNSRTAGWHWLRAAAVPIGGAFVGVWLAVFVVLAAWGGAAYAWFAANRVPATVFSRSFSESWSSSYAMLHAFGFQAPWPNFVSHFIAGLLLMLICAAMLVAGGVWARAENPPGVRWAALLALAIMTGAVAWRLSWATWHQQLASGNADETPPFSWLQIGRAVVFPTLLTALGVVAAAFYAARKGKAWWPRAVRLAVFGTAAALMLVRMVLNGNITYYGFFMQPLAVLFLLYLLVVEIPAYFPSGRGGPLIAAFALLALCGIAQVGRMSQLYYARKTYPVGDGRDRFYAFPPEIFPDGLFLNTMVALVKERAPQAHTVIAIPESAAVNYQLRLKNPSPDFGFLPTDLEYAGRDRVLAGLQAHPPDAFVFFCRDMSEFGAGYFGQDAASGRDILQWILQDYEPVARFRHPGGDSPFSYNGDLVDVLVRRNNSQPVTSR